MHPAPSLAEAPPNKSDELRPVQHLASPKTGAAPNPAPEDHVRRPGSASPPVRKDTTSSTSTAATVSTLATQASAETAATQYTVDAPPSFATQAVFSARDGSNVATQRRASRRRTGPLTAVQRERAHLIRKMGACGDCRRRRVAVSAGSPASRCLVCRLTYLPVPSQPPQHDMGGGCQEV